MRILKIDKKNCFLEVIPQSLDDLWQLQQAIQEGDIVSGTSERKVKAKEEGMKATKETVFLEIETERVEFHKPSGQLRVLGTIVAGKPEAFVQLKAHHTVEIEPNKKIGIRKKSLSQFEIDGLKKAERESFKAKIMLLVLDDEQADFAELRSQGIEKKATIKSGKSGKQFKAESNEKKYFAELLATIKQAKFDALVVAGPGFAKESFKKFLAEKRETGNVFFTSTNSIGITGLNELLKSEALEKVFEEANAAEETKKVEKLFVEIAKQGAVAIGAKETGQALDASAVAELLIEEETFLNNRGQSTELIKKAESQKAKIHLISAGHEAGQKLKGIGGIAAMLRYKLN